MWFVVSGAAGRGRPYRGWGEQPSHGSVQFVLRAGPVRVVGPLRRGAWLFEMTNHVRNFEQKIDIELKLRQRFAPSSTCGALHLAQITKIPGRHTS